MPLLTDIREIRARLRRDPVWCAYALCDLSPDYFPRTRWFAPGPTLVLNAYGTSILFSTDPTSVPEALAAVSWPAHLQVREDALAEVERHAVVEQVKSMWRLSWADRGRLRAPGDPGVAARRLGEGDVPALRRLYADGDATGEAPDFFIPSQVPEGVFYGIAEDGELIAAAGTHIVSRDEGAATVGNVYTRRDRRGRGLSRAVVSAVLLAVADIEVVALNVRVDNAAALHLYETLGFVRHCRFYEAVATGWRADATRASV